MRQAAFLFSFFLIFLAAAVHFSRSPEKESSAKVDTYQDIAVVEVYDGDTIKLANGDKVRLLGIDTPETHKNKRLFRAVARSGRGVKEVLQMGAAAEAYARSLLDGQRVRLEFDIERQDKYGRLLAYVFRVSDGLFVNEEIIRNGYAYPFTIPPNLRYTDRFRSLFRQAREARRGLWAESLARDERMP